MPYSQLICPKYIYNLKKNNCINIQEIFFKFKIKN